MWPTGFRSPTGAVLRSVIPMLVPPNGGYYHQDTKSKFLLHNTDEHLPDGLWARLRTSAAGTVATWRNVKYADDVIQFETEASSGVAKVNLGRINRELKHNQYCVVRTHLGPAEIPALELGLAIEYSELYLHNTYWGRLPAILGPVRDSLMMKY
jgi:hypothetical protein